MGFNSGTHKSSSAVEWFMLQPVPRTVGAVIVWHPSFSDSLDSIVSDRDCMKFNTMEMVIGLKNGE